ncbi:MAG: exosortase C-terminal domain/associated protein EpsI [bacterium]
MAITFATNTWIRAAKTTNSHKVNLHDFPRQFEDWVAEEYQLNDQIRSVLRTDQILLRRYQDTEGRKAELFIGYYQDQKFGAQVHSPQHCLPGSGWTIVRQEKYQLPFDTEASCAKKLQIVKNGENQLVIYWFASDGQVVQNEFELKIRLLINAFKHRATSVYFFRICIPFATNEEGKASEVLRRFVNMAGSSFNLRYAEAPTQ